MKAQEHIEQPSSQRITHLVLSVDEPTGTDFRLPDEPDLPRGYVLQPGGVFLYQYIKSALDFLAALIILTLTFPVILICALIVRCTSRGTAFYSQIRVGLGGRPFVIYKLRSMYQDCERTSGIRWSSKGDNRVTPIGRFLRRSHIDELPQLWNVLCGHMSLIGPRPERPELVVSLEKALPRYRDRLLVKPGLAGLAQIQLPPDSDLESVRKKLVLDRVYVQRRSFWLDLRIYFGTLMYLLGYSCHRIQGVLALPSEMRRDSTPSVISPAPVKSRSDSSPPSSMRPVPVLD